MNNRQIAARIVEVVNAGRERFLADNPFVPDIIQRHADLLCRGAAFPLGVNDPAFRPLLESCLERAIVEAVAARSVDPAMDQVIAAVVKAVTPIVIRKATDAASKMDALGRKPERT